MPDGSLLDRPMPPATGALAREPVVDKAGLRLMELQVDLRKHEAALAAIGPGRPLTMRLALAKVAKRRHRIASHLDAHPAARAYEHELDIREEAARQGILDRVEAVRLTLGSPAFAEAMATAATEATGAGHDPRNEEDVRDLVLAVLDGMQVDATDVLITVFWAPPHLSGTVRGMTPKARQRCLAAVLSRAGKADA